MATEDKNKNEKKDDIKGQKNPDQVSNTANVKGAQDLGIDGTEPTASQQKGQGSWDKKDND